MDTFTLQVVNIAIALIVSVTMAGLLLATPRDRSLLHWFFSAAASFVYTIIIFAYTPESWPYWAGPAAGNTSLVASYLFLLSGIALFFGIPLRKRTLIIVLLVIFLANMLPLMQSDVLHRVLLNFPLFLLLNLLCLYLVLTRANALLRHASLLLVFVLLFNIIQLFGRFITILQLQLGWSPLLSQEHSIAIGTMSVMLFMLMSMVGCVLLLVRQKTLQLQKMLETDPLTGWLNRHNLDKRLEHEWHRCQREQKPFSLLLFDIDHFKQVNDQHGHAIGDMVLQHITELAKQQLRGYDLLFRIGGEEFVVVLPGVNAKSLQIISERLRLHIANTSPPSPLAAPLHISIGCATQQPETADWQELLQQADKALYQAKSGGRNCVVFALESGHESTQACS